MIIQERAPAITITAVACAIWLSFVFPPWGTYIVGAQAIASGLTRRMKDEGKDETP